MERISDKDLEIVRGQLQRNVTNVVAVIKYCSFGYPIVILSYPVKDNQPFPTIHYLTCPYLVKEVSRLEEKRFISKFEEKILNDKDFANKYVNANFQVSHKRRKLLKNGDKKWNKYFENLGTGGIRNLTSVKCLHLHLADYLAGIDNPVGKEVYELIDNKECKTEICKVFKDER
ncbi:MAG: DUF501 domain-containing protein [Fervidobacterium sp.]|jgi:hypothetical protein